MIRQEIHNILFQFKRVHKKQIAHKEPLLSPELEDSIKRKVLNRMSDKELKILLSKLIKAIDGFQKDREKPHFGIAKFRDSIEQHVH